jgi:CubicO group peptidase (beta-lactamase class C family)
MEEKEKSRSLMQPCGRRLQSRERFNFRENLYQPLHNRSDGNTRSSVFPAALLNSMAGTARWSSAGIIDLKAFSSILSRRSLLVNRKFMKPIILTVISVALFGLHLAAAEPALPEQFTSVREFISNSISGGRAPSVAVAVVKDDKLLWAEGFGFADLAEKRPATSESIYLLASVSKPITATGLMLLVDRGQIELDKPANDYLPGAKLQAVRGSANDMTLRRLANHTSGMLVHYNFYYDNVAPLSYDEVIRRYGFAHTVPGARVEYCNLAFGVLDYVTEIVSKTPWGQFMEKNVYDAIGMSHTSDRVRPGLEADATVQYQLDIAGKFIPVPRYGFDHNGASAIWSSATDLSRFLRLHLNGGMVDGKRLLKEDTAHSMLRVTGVMNTNKPQDGFGVAWRVGSHLGRRSFEHTGGMPGVATWVRGFPEDKSGFVILINASGGSLMGQIAQRLTKALFPEAKDDSVDESKKPAAPEEKEGQFAGKWKGKLAHFEGDIPMLLEVKEDGTARVTLGKSAAVALRDVAFKNTTFVGQTRGILTTQPGYHGPVTLEFRLADFEGRLCGIGIAKADGYFALSHGVELMKEQNSETHSDQNDE